MATYYLKPAADGGSDAAAGTSESTAWATPSKLLGAAGMASGDTAYVAPGRYNAAFSVAMTSATVETIIEGDPEATRFPNSTPGEVRWTSYTSGDTSAPAATTCINLAARDFLTFRKMTIEGGNAAPSCVSGVTTTPTNITFTDCLFTVYCAAVAVRVSPAALSPVHRLFDRCTFACLGSGQTTIDILPATSSTGADWDLDVIVRNCLFIGRNGGSHISCAPTGALTFKPGGIVVMNNTFMGGSVGLTVTGTSTSVVCTAYNNVILGAAGGLQAGSSGQITEDYNVILAATPHTTVTPGSNSVYGNVLNRANLMEFGQWAVQGRRPRPHYMPAKGSPLIGFGDNGGAPATDWLNRPRPSGDTSKTVGAVERHDTGLIDATGGESGGSCISITGPGDHDIRVPVDAVSTVISVKVNYDATHATTNPPQAILLANGRIGVTTETVTASATTGSWLTLTFAAQTPSAKGVVTVRLVSRSAADAGIAKFDTFA